MATRRGILQGALLVGGALAIVARPWNWFVDPPVEVTPIVGLEPFRRLVAAGDLSGGLGGVDVALIGIPDPDAAEPSDPALMARLRGNLPDVLWGGWRGDAPVPVTYFTDIQCPVCRGLEARLAALEGITLKTREYPIFGEASERAARAILAAEEQGEGEALRRRFHRAPNYRTEGALAATIAAMPLNRNAFFAAMAGREVAARLAEDRALARIFSLPGTPALVIGRTLVIGLQSLDVLRAVVALEQAGPVPA